MTAIASTSNDEIHRYIIESLVNSALIESLSLNFRWPRTHAIVNTVLITCKHLVLWCWLNQPAAHKWSRFQTFITLVMIRGAWHGNAIHIIRPLWGESRVTGGFRTWKASIWFRLLVWASSWTNNPFTSDLRCYDPIGRLMVRFLKTSKPKDWCLKGFCLA